MLVQIREVLSRDEVAHCRRVLEAAAWADGELALAHDPAWIDAVFSGATTPAQQREIGFPWSERMVERARRSVGASIAASRGRNQSQSRLSQKRSAAARSRAGSRRCSAPLNGRSRS